MVNEVRNKLNSFHTIFLKIIITVNDLCDGSDRCVFPVKQTGSQRQKSYRMIKEVIPESQ